MAFHRQLLRVAILASLDFFWYYLLELLDTSLDISSTYHLQTDGQTEVTNHFLGNHLYCLIGSSIKTLDSKLPQEEF